MSALRAGAIEGMREMEVEEPPMDTKRNPAQGAFEDSFISVLGTRMHYVRAGSGRPLLLIHGLIGSWSNWRRNIDALAQHATVYAIDLANMGKSQRVKGLDAGLEATADRVAACMDALGLAQADIAGHSHGGAIAWFLAARHPGRVRSLILFAPANPYSDLGDPFVRVYTTSLGSLVVRAAPYLPSRMHMFALGRMYGDPSRIPDGSLQGYVGGLRARGTVRHVLAILRGWFKDMEKLQVALPRLADIPTLLVWGDRDRAVDLHSALRLQQILPRSELRVVHGGGHALFEEMPEESNQLMLEWLRRDLPSVLPPAIIRPPSTRKPRTLPRSAPIAARTIPSALPQPLSPET